MLATEEMSAAEILDFGSTEEGGEFEATEQANPLTRCQTWNTTVSGHCRPGQPAFSKNVSAILPRGMRCTNVQLSGWELSFEPGLDREVNKLSVRVHAVSYNPNTGQLKFTVSGTLANRIGRDDVYWRVAITVLGLA